MIENQLDSVTIENIAASSKSRVEFWVRLIDLAQLGQIAEVGVWKGEFAETVLRSCPAVRSYCMIDPWRRLDQWNKPMNVADVAFDEVYREALRRTEFAADRRIVLRGTTLDVVGEIPDESQEFVYIDGDHTLRGVAIDLIACYAKVKPGFFLAGDDFCSTIWQHSLKFEPTMVFPFAIHFAEAVGATLYCLPFNQFLLHKPRDGKGQFAVIDFTGRYRDTSLLAQLSLRTLMAKAIRENIPDPLKGPLRRLGRLLTLRC